MVAAASESPSGEGGAFARDKGIQQDTCLLYSSIGPVTLPKVLLAGCRATTIQKARWKGRHRKEPYSIKSHCGHKRDRSTASRLQGIQEGEWYRI